MPESITILVVDDERPLVGVITSHLEREGFVVLEAFDGPSAVDVAERQRPDLILVDIDLPGFDGIEVCRRIREFSDAYVVMLTARDEESDKVDAFGSGADDYVVKPFSARELIARLQAMLRRPRASTYQGPVHLRDLRIDLGARTVRGPAGEIALTRTEFAILAALLEQRGAACTRRQIIDAVWGAEWFGDEQVVDVHVGHLRRKLGDKAGAPRYVRTVRGVGYAAASTPRQ
ncbi:MAG: response regulator transcription factor [Actinomycetes bacterium]